MSKPAQTPAPPYYAVIFTSTRAAGGDVEYGATAERMVELAQQQPGFLGVESARDANGLGITVSYWESEEAIANWKKHGEHRVAQGRGWSEWYDEFFTRVAKVERANAFKR